MTGARTQAVLAAALADPLLIDAWRDDERSRPTAIGGVDLDTLRRFGGLSYKVRHNGLRQVMPLSFRLLRVLGVELDLFAAYFAARGRSGTTLAATDRQRMHDLVAFVRGWRGTDASSDRLVCDMMCHESALSELAAGESGAGSAEHDTTLTATSRLAVRGRLIRHDLMHDPAAIAAALSAQGLGAVSATPLAMGYWRRPGSDRVEQLRLDAFAAAMLDAIDGTMTLDAVSERLLGIGASDRFIAMAGELVLFGVAQVDPVG